MYCASEDRFSRKAFVLNILFVYHMCLWKCRTTLLTVKGSLYSLFVLANRQISSLFSSVSTQIDFLKVLHTRKAVMTTCLETRKSTFNLHDQFGLDQHLFTTVGIIVAHNKYTDGGEFYDISYEYTYSKGNETTRRGHPFVGYPNMDDHTEGDIIAVNELTTALVKYALMDIDELRNHSGRVHPNTYKLSVLHAITEFWD
jgi:hypothetical protein